MYEYMYTYVHTYVYIYINIYRESAALALSLKRDAMPAKSVAALRRSASSLKLQGRNAAAC